MTTAALCAQDLMVERKIWRHIKAWEREMADFEAKPKGNNPWIWDCIVPGKPGTIFADGRFPVVLDFRKSSCFGLPTAHVPEEFGSNLEIREKHLDNQQFEGVPISCYNTVWGTYALALRCLVPPSQAVPNTSIKTILLKVQESKFTSFENYDDKCYGKEEWTHIIAKYVPKVDENEEEGVRMQSYPTRRPQQFQARERGRRIIGMQRR